MLFMFANQSSILSEKPIKPKNSVAPRIGCTKKYKLVAVCTFNPGTKKEYIVKDVRYYRTAAEAEMAGRKYANSIRNKRAHVRGVVSVFAPVTREIVMNYTCTVEPVTLKVHELMQDLIIVKVYK